MTSWAWADLGGALASLVTAPLKLTGDKLSLRVLVDRGSVEVFASGGAVAVSSDM